MKAYATKSSAIRAAKKTYGESWEEQAAILPALPEQGEGWIILPKASPASPELEAEAPRHLSLAEALAESGESLAELMDDIPSPSHMDQSGPQSKAGDKLALGWRLSTCEKPTKKVWAIADSMPGASRKEVIAACIAAGIGEGTSRTQYQAWYSAMKASGLSPRA